MNKSVISAVIFSVACSVSFIFGFLFNEAHQTDKKDLIKSTIAQSDQLRKLDDSFGYVFHFESVLKDLESVTNQEEIENLKKKYKETGKRHVNDFREKLVKIQKYSTHPEFLEALEINVNEMEKAFE